MLLCVYMVLFMQCFEWHGLVKEPTQHDLDL